MVVVLKNTWFYRYRQRKQKENSAASAAPTPTTSLVEAVNGSALTLEGVDHIESGHRLPPRVFRVGHGVFHHILQKGLDHRSGFLIDLARDSLHSAPPRQSADGRLGDPGDVAFTALAESLGSSLSQSFASFSSSGHIETEAGYEMEMELLLLIDAKRADERLFRVLDDE